MAITLSSITPDHGLIAGGTPVTIAGTGLAAVNAVTFGGVAATSVVATATTVTCTTPAHAAGAVDVVVDDGTSTATLTAAFEYQEATVTDLGFSYELGVDITTPDKIDSAVEGDWTPLRYISAVNPGGDKTFKDAATYADQGAQRQTITGETWTLALYHQLQRDATTGAFVPELQTLIAATEPGKRNAAAQVAVRFYDTAGADYARKGLAYVAMSRAADGNDDVAGFNFTLTGDGALSKIANPVAA